MLLNVLIKPICLCLKTNTSHTTNQYKKNTQKPLIHKGFLNFLFLISLLLILYTRYKVLRRGVPLVLPFGQNLIFLVNNRSLHWLRCKAARGYALAAPYPHSRWSLRYRRHHLTSRLDGGRRPCRLRKSSCYATHRSRTSILHHQPFHWCGGWREFGGEGACPPSHSPTAFQKSSCHYTCRYLKILQYSELFTNYSQCFVSPKHLKMCYSWGGVFAPWLVEREWTSS